MVAVKASETYFLYYYSLFQHPAASHLCFLRNILDRRPQVADHLVPRYIELHLDRAYRAEPAKRDAELVEQLLSPVHRQLAIDDHPEMLDLVAHFPLLEESSVHARLSDEIAVQPALEPNARFVFLEERLFDAARGALLSSPLIERLWKGGSVGGLRIWNGVAENLDGELV